MTMTMTYGDSDKPLRWPPSRRCARLKKFQCKHLLHLQKAFRCTLLWNHEFQRTCTKEANNESTRAQMVLGVFNASYFPHSQRSFTIKGPKNNVTHKRLIFLSLGLLPPIHHRSYATAGRTSPNSQVRGEVNHKGPWKSLQKVFA